jgi:hypothetical protein
MRGPGGPQGGPSRSCAPPLSRRATPLPSHTRCASIGFHSRPRARAPDGRSARLAAQVALPPPPPPSRLVEPLAGRQPPRPLRVSPWAWWRAAPAPPHGTGSLAAGAPTVIVLQHAVRCAPASLLHDEAGACDPTSQSEAQRRGTLGFRQNVLVVRKHAAWHPRRAILCVL